MPLTFNNQIKACVSKEKYKIHEINWKHPVLILILKIAGVQILFYIRLGTEFSLYNLVMIQVRNLPHTRILILNFSLLIKKEAKVIQNI